MSISTCMYIWNCKRKKLELHNSLASFFYIQKEKSQNHQQNVEYHSQGSAHQLDGMEEAAVGERAQERDVEWMTKKYKNLQFKT